MITTYRRGGTMVLRVEGPLEGVEAGRLLEQHPSLVACSDPVVVDLTRSSRLSSAGMRTLLLLHRRREPDRRRVVIVGGSPRTRTALRTLGLTALFPTADSVTDALELVA